MFRMAHSVPYMPVVHYYISGFGYYQNFVLIFFGIAVIHFGKQHAKNALFMGRWQHTQASVHFVRIVEINANVKHGPYFFAIKYFAYRVGMPAHLFKTAVLRVYIMVKYYTIAFAIAYTARFFGQQVFHALYTYIRN